MLKIDGKTLRSIGNLSRQHPQLLKYFAEFHTSLREFAARHIPAMAIGDLVGQTSFEVELAGAALRFEFQAALNDAEPVGMVNAYEPRSNNQGDYKVSSLLFNQRGMSTLGVPNGEEVDFVFIAEEVVAEIFRKLLVARVQPD